jgi:hypothetical protein
MDNLGWAPAFCDYKKIMAELKSEDEMNVYQGIMELQTQLSMAQENTLKNFNAD